MIERLLAADAALDRDDLEIAHRLFTQVADADPRNAIAVVGLARVAARQNTPDEALALARRALEIDPDEAAGRRLLAELQATGAARELTTPGAAMPDPAAPARAIAQRAIAESEPQPVAPPATAVKPRRSRWRTWIDRILGRG